jgi:hypothetical protein
MTRNQIIGMIVLGLLIFALDMAVSYGNYVVWNDAFHWARTK